MSENGSQQLFPPMPPKQTQKTIHCGRVEDTALAILLLELGDTNSIFWRGVTITLAENQEMISSGNHKTEGHWCVCPLVPESWKPLV